MKVSIFKVSYFSYSKNFPSLAWIMILKSLWVP